MPTAAWLRENSTRLRSLDPGTDLTDLEPLRDIAGDARVVAIGENAHFVEEFSAIRERVARFLAERCGFTVFAFEFGFGAAPAVGRWLTGAHDRTLREVNPAVVDFGSSGLLHWLREYNRSGAHPLRFAGIDVPEAGGALRPVLEPLADYLRDADPDALPLVETALEISDAFLDGLGSGAAAAPAWARLAPAEQDALTAGLARLWLRFQAVEPLAVARTDAARYAVAERMLAAACAVDHMFRAMNDLFAGRPNPVDLAARDVFMAETLRWHLEHGEPGAKIVLVAANNHIQKTPSVFDGTLSGLTMGGYLARDLGEDYVAIAATHTAGHVPEMFPDASVPVGFTVADVDLPAPPPGTIEAGLADAGLGAAITLTDLRGSPRDERGEPLLTGIRTQSAVTDAPLPDAFDAVISAPTVTRDPTVAF